MKPPDMVLRELSKLYEFYRELAKFRFKGKHKPTRGMRANAPTSRR